MPDKQSGFIIADIYMIGQKTIKSFFNQMTGQSLIEITIALGAISVLLSVSAIIVINTLNNVQDSKFRNQAGIYAQQGIEIIRQLRDADWNNFTTFSGNYCLPDSCNTITASGTCGKKVAACNKIDATFERIVFIQHNEGVYCSAGGINGTRAIVSVTWTDSKCTAPECRRVNTQTCLFNIYGQTGL